MRQYLFFDSLSIKKYGVWQTKDSYRCPWTDTKDRPNMVYYCKSTVCNRHTECLEIITTLKGKHENSSTKLANRRPFSSKHTGRNPGFDRVLIEDLLLEDLLLKDLLLEDLLLEDVVLEDVVLEDVVLEDVY